MKYRFGPFEIDLAAYRLTEGGSPVHVEPLAFDLLALFVANAGEVIDRDRMCADVWKGRIVSDSAFSTAIKTLRSALGDSGEAQKYIETVRGRGFRFVPAPEQVAPPSAQPTAHVPPGEAARHATGPGPDTATDERDTPSAATRRTRPSIAVLPFVRLGGPEPFAGLEEAIPHETILALSRLRWLSVIARGSAFRFRGEEQELAHVASTLGVGYCLTGTVELFGRSLSVGVELARTCPPDVIWGNMFTGTIDDVHELRADIVSGVISALEERIPLHEAIEAEKAQPETLDAWQMFHLGLTNLFRFNKEGNARAGDYFSRAITMDPGFARAHAGLSLTHFQTAFLGDGRDRLKEMHAIRQSAELAVDRDPLDPLVNFAMGRCHWLEKDLEGAEPWLERATQISPSYAQGIYARGMIDMMTGRSTNARQHLRTAMELSPLDPMLYAMRASTAMSCITDGDISEAARWADAAARTPRAHAIIHMISAACHALDGQNALAERAAATARSLKPDASVTFLFDGLPVRPGAMREQLSTALGELGF